MYLGHNRAPIARALAPITETNIDHFYMSVSMSGAHLFILLLLFIVSTAAWNTWNHHEIAEKCQSTRAINYYGAMIATKKVAIRRQNSQLIDRERANHTYTP